jgi:hypothetical protein
VRICPTPIQRRSTEAQSSQRAGVSKIDAWSTRFTRSASTTGSDPQAKESTAVAAPPASIWTRSVV